MRRAVSAYARNYRGISKHIRYTAIVALLICAISIFTVFTPENNINVHGEKFYGSNFNMRIGLAFGSGAVSSFDTSAPCGFIIGTVKNNANDAFNSFFYLNKTKIAVAPCANLAKNSAGRYYTSNSGIVVGKYSLEFTRDFSDFTEAYNFIGNTSKSLTANMYPAYINGKIKVRLLDFSSSDNAATFMSRALSGYGLKVASDSSKAALVINPDTNEILFAFDDGDNNLAIAAAASRSPANSAYGQKITELSANTTGITTTSADNIYAGAFIYRTSSSSSASSAGGSGSSGVEVIGLFSLEEYIKGVVPNEVYSTWEKEALKAFAVTARTFAVNSSSGRRHPSSGFMMCNDTHCQFYTGTKRATDSTNAAVEETKDLIITYDNKPIEAYYCSSSGGVTENSSDAWGGAHIPYLVSVPLPEERYWERPDVNAVWTKSASSRELFEYLTETSGYAARFKGVIKTDIASITVNSRSPGSNYIKSLTVTDRKGNSVTISNSDNIRVAFRKYANSANMDIYRAYKFRHQVVSSGTVELESGKTNIITGNGVRKLSSGDGKLKIITSGGESAVSAYSGGGDFIFDGRGWGHGVGMSQWAAQDMAKAGYNYEEIIKTFYTGVSVKTIKNVPVMQ